MGEETAPKPIGLDRVFDDADRRIERSLGLPAHAVLEQTRNRTRALMQAGAIEPMPAFSGGELGQHLIIPVGLIEFLTADKQGIIDEEGTLWYCNTRDDRGNHIRAIDLDTKIQPHDDPTYSPFDILRLNQQITEALRTVKSNFEERQANTKAQVVVLFGDDSDEGLEARTLQGLLPQ